MKQDAVSSNSINDLGQVPLDESSSAELASCAIKRYQISLAMHGQDANINVCRLQLSESISCIYVSLRG
jgi:hypothetical protein